jgi:excisionase family DNA binding protein
VSTGAVSSAASTETRGISRCTPLHELPEFLTVQEFGQYLDLSKNNVYALVASGGVEVVRFGRLIRIPKRALERR